MMHCGAAIATSDCSWNPGKVVIELWEWFCKLTIEDRIQALTVEDPLWARLYLVLLKKEERDGKALRLKREIVNNMYKKLLRKETNPHQAVVTTTTTTTTTTTGYTPTCHFMTSDEDVEALYDHAALEILTGKHRGSFEYRGPLESDEGYMKKIDALFAGERVSREQVRHVL